MRFAIVAAALSTMAAASLTSASAAPTIAGGIYMDQSVKSCSSASSACEVEFAAVPAGKTLVITDAGCAVNTASGIALVSSTLRGRTAGGATVNRNAYFQPLQTSPSGDRRYQMQLNTHLILLAGEKPNIFLSASAASAGFAANCTVAGELK